MNMFRNCKWTRGEPSQPCQPAMEWKTFDELIPLIQALVETAQLGTGTIMGRDLKGRFNLGDREIEYDLHDYRFTFTALSKGASE